MAIATISVNFATPGETYTGTLTDKSINPFAFKEALKIADYVNNYIRKAGDSVTGTLTFNIGAGATAITALNQNINLGNAGVIATGTLTAAGQVSVAGITTISNGTASTARTNGALIVTGGVGISGTLNCSTLNTNGVVSITNATASSSTGTGALVVAGGVGVAGALNVGGDITAFATSDERLKDNITIIDSAIEKVEKFDGVSFDWKENSGHSGRDYGVIAQQIEKVLPEIVATRDDGFKAVRYEKLIPVLIEAIKELNLKIKKLETK